MEYEATVVLEHVAIEPPPSGDDAENFVMQLVQCYLEGQNDQSAEQVPAPGPYAERATFECPLRKPGWFRRG